MQYARILARGNDDVSDSDVAEKSYAAIIGIGERAPESILLSMATDANDAAELLSAMSHEALAFLTTNRAERSATSRADLVSFERTLVQAQKTRRVFVEALELVDAGDTASVDAAIAKFDRQIDRARTVADRLAREYAGRGVGVVS